MQEKQKEYCVLIEELLPLYQEHNIGKETEKIIKDHLENCPTCQKKNEEAASWYPQKIRKTEVSLSEQENEERGRYQAVSKKLKKRKVRNICLGILLAVSLFLAYEMSFQNLIMAGDSMEPKIVNGDHCLVSKISYLLHGPRRGDIVMLQMDSSHLYGLYRIVGIPGDVIEISKGQLSVNGSIDPRYDGIGATESYQKNPGNLKLTVPENQYFFLGDRFEISYDSRYVGCVGRQDIIGKYVLTSRLPRLGVDSSVVDATEEDGPGAMDQQ